MATTIPGSVPALGAPRSSSIRSFALETRFEFLRLARKPAYVAPLFAFPLAFYYFFGIALNGSQHIGRAGAATYLLASYGAFGVMGAALFGFGVSLAIERGHGWLLLRRASPMRIGAYFAAKTLCALAFALAVVLTLEALGAFAGGVHLAAATWFALTTTLVAGTIPFCALGFAIGTLAPPDSAPVFVNLIYLPLSFMGGLWVPASMLPKTFASIAPWTPTYHFGRLAHAALGIDRASAGDVAALVMWTAIFLAAAAFGWKRDESRGNA